MSSPVFPPTSWRHRIDRLRALAGRHRRRVAFVFSGGGNLGAVQVGMLRALVEAGIRPDLVVGCSVGAINGAAYAAEPGQAAVDRLERIWGRLSDGDPELMPSGFIPLVAQMARKGESLHDQQTLAGLLDEELPTKTFDGLVLPFSCVATDVETASETWFDSGRLVPALLASAALPAVYPPFVRAGRDYIDGGVLNEVHALRAVELGATELYVLHVGHLDDRVQEVQRPFDAALQAYWTARRYRMEDDLRRIPEHCVVHRLPAGSSPRLRFDDFSQGRELARLAHAATAEYLATGRAPSPVTGPVSAPLPHDGAEDDIEVTTASFRRDNGVIGTAAESMRRLRRRTTDEQADSAAGDGGPDATADAAGDRAVGGNGRDPSEPAGSDGADGAETDTDADTGTGTDGGRARRPGTRNGGGPTGDAMTSDADDGPGSGTERTGSGR